jgi:hypothetical protein
LFFCQVFFAAHFYSPIILRKTNPKIQRPVNNIDPNPLEKPKQAPSEKKQLNNKSHSPEKIFPLLLEEEFFLYGV